MGTPFLYRSMRLRALITVAALGDICVILSVLAGCCSQMLTTNTSERGII